MTSPDFFCNFCACDQVIMLIKKLLGLLCVGFEFKGVVRHTKEIILVNFHYFLTQAANILIIGIRLS